jgi:hypothetical protein
MDEMMVTTSIGPREADWRNSSFTGDRNNDVGFDPVAQLHSRKATTYSYSAMKIQRRYLTGKVGVGFIFCQLLDRLCGAQEVNCSTQTALPQDDVGTTCKVSRSPREAENRRI